MREKEGRRKGKGGRIKIEIRNFVTSKIYIFYI